jgi:outer membrane phospholipase A
MEGYAVAETASIVARRLARLPTGWNHPVDGKRSKSTSWNRKGDQLFWNML